MQKREKFSSRLGFILISAGCAIGLGNVYRFPIITGAYGGAFFVLIYLLFLLILGIPVMTAELAVGRCSQRSVATSFEQLERKGQKWHWIKYIGIGGNYLLMMFYTCISAWLVIYFARYVSGSILQYEGVEALGGMFNAMVSNTALVLPVTFAVILLCFGICSRGLQKGVEKINKIMMVLLLALILGLAIYCCTLPGAGAGLKFYLVPSLKNLKNAGVWTSVSAAMGQAFFTLSLGIGAIAVFGSYIGKDRSLMGEAVTITALDTFVAIMSGLIVFPAYFTFNVGAQGIPAEQAGAGFLFTTLSSIFNSMGSGRVIGALFFLFMIFAALSTVIAVFENIMSFWLERTGLGRKKVALINIVLLAVLALPCVFSSSIWSHITILGKNMMDLEDYLVTNLFLPIGSLLYVLFCTSRYGWGWKNFKAEANLGRGLKVPDWIRPYMTYILPLIIVVVLVMSAF